MEEKLTEEQKQWIISRPHKYFPWVKLVILNTLYDGSQTELEFLINASKFFKVNPSTVLVNLYKYKRQGYLNKKDGRWYITKRGREHCEYLIDRLENEFFGDEGLKFWIKYRREQKLREREEAKKLQQKNPES